MNEHSLDLSTTNYGQVRRLNYDLAVLPWGATEPHNWHLPYLTDSILSKAIALDAAEWTFTRSGIRCMVLPPINLGSQNPGQYSLPFCVHARYETQKAILTDIVASLEMQGLQKLVIINGHGGNNFKNMIRDLAFDRPDFLIATSDWYSIVPSKDYFEEPGEHADELETSVMMHYHPELVKLEEAGDGRSKRFAAETLNDKVAWVPRNWNEVTEDTGIGNPHKATAQKGAAFAQAVVERYAALFEDLTKNTVFYR